MAIKSTKSKKRSKQQKTTRKTSMKSAAPARRSLAARWGEAFQELVPAGRRPRSAATAQKPARPKTATQPRVRKARTSGRATGRAVTRTSSRAASRSA